MAKKQNDYLASLLSDDDDAPLPVRTHAPIKAAPIAASAGSVGTGSVVPSAGPSLGASEVASSGAHSSAGPNSATSPSAAPSPASPMSPSPASPSAAPSAQASMSATPDHATQPPVTADKSAAREAKEGGPTPPTPQAAATSSGPTSGPAPTSGPSSALAQTPPRATARAGLSLLGRESALARVASGEVRQITQLLIDPARVRVWSGNARIQSELSESNCRDLIDSILAEGVQKVAAVVRHVTDDPTYDYELIAGTRRHFSISWLRANHYPDMKLLAQVAELDDEAAFRLADIENRARKDISDIERARNYAQALDSHYGGKAVRMAERLNVSKGWLSKMLKAASVPDSVLAAFPTLTDLALNPAYKLALALDDKPRAKAIRKEADAIVAENRKASAQGRLVLSGTAALARLMAATSVPLESSADLSLDIEGALGRPIVRVKSVNRQGITLHLPMASGASDEDLAQALKLILARLRENGVVVQ